MSVHRALFLAVIVYLGTDYCDPSVPGVFWFGTATFFVDSVGSRVSARAAVPPPASPVRIRDASVPPRRTVMPPAHASMPAPTRSEHQPYVPRAHAGGPPPAAPGGAEDH